MAVTTRTPMERRAGHDLSAVRIHDDEAASSLAETLKARAFTLGADIAFARGHYAPGTPAGDRLLAHEVAHAVQQFGATASVQPDVGDPRTSQEREAERFAAGGGAVLGRVSSMLVQRDAQPGVQGGGSQLSVDPAAYKTMLASAVGLMSGQFVSGQTFASVVQPMLTALIQNPLWRTADGKVTGSGMVRYVHPGPPPLPLDLALELDDTNDPKQNGLFTASPNTTTGRMWISIRRNPDQDAAASTLYHESMHFVAWLQNRPQPALTDPTFLRRSRELTMSFHAPEIAAASNFLEDLANSINNRRAAVDRVSVTRAEAEKVGRWLVEEVHVRSETEVFRLALQEQELRTQTGPTVRIGTWPYSAVNRGMVIEYVFDHTAFSNLFKPSDKAGMTDYESNIISNLADTLAGVYGVSVTRRFQVPRRFSIPRAEMDLPIQPLQPPKSFLQQGLPLPP